MKYHEISGLLLRQSIDVGGPVRAVEDPSANVTWLSVDRVASFIAVADTQELDITIRRGEDLIVLERLTISFANVTPLLIMGMLDRALIEVAGRIIEQSSSRTSRMPRGGIACCESQAHAH